MTGVQTCALPISLSLSHPSFHLPYLSPILPSTLSLSHPSFHLPSLSRILPSIYPLSLPSFLPFQLNFLCLSSLLRLHRLPLPLPLLLSIPFRLLPLPLPLLLSIPFRLLPLTLYLLLPLPLLFVLFLLSLLLLFFLPNLQLIQNATVMGALTRVLQEEYKKSTELTFNILRCLSLT